MGRWLSPRRWKLGRRPEPRPPAPLDREQRQRLQRRTYAYIDWREECAAVEAAYRRWVGAAESDAQLAYAAYVAGLDREERAAVVYRELAAPRHG